MLLIVLLVAVAVFGGLVALLMSAGGSETAGSLDSILRDVGYVVLERKGIGIQR